MFYHNYSNQGWGELVFISKMLKAPFENREKMRLRRVEKVD